MAPRKIIILVAQKFFIRVKVHAAARGNRLAGNSSVRVVTSMSLVRWLREDSTPLLPHLEDGAVVSAN